MSVFVSHPPTLSARRALGAGIFSRIGQRAFAAILAWRINMRQRRELLMLNDVELRELSLAAADIDHEASKRFWEGVSLTRR